MPDFFESPLRRGMIVECADKLTVKILTDPVWNTFERRYEVRIQILEPGERGRRQGGDPAVLSCRSRSVWGQLFL